MQLIPLPPKTPLLKVERERCGRGNVFAACDDCRRQYLILSQRICLTSEAIQTLAGENAPPSSLYDGSRRLRRKGRIGSFSIVKLTPQDAPAWLEANRCRYDEVCIVTAQPSKWVTLPTSA